MFIVLGVVGVLWFVGFVVTPDKNEPPLTQQTPPAAVASATPTSAPATNAAHRP
ncbi:MAG TPA: hypothetical protein VLV50_18530 [Stellaceae bacterium]|nr:hypothetical protein [Stellaceae bacterium]